MRGAAMGGGGGEGVRRRWTRSNGADCGVGLLDSEGEVSCGDENSEKLHRAAARGKEDGGTKGDIRLTSRERDDGDGPCRVVVVGTELCGEHGPATASCNIKNK